MPLCPETNPHNDLPCVDITPEHHVHVDNDMATWITPHACTMCPVRDKDGNILKHNSDPNDNTPF